MECVRYAVARLKIECLLTFLQQFNGFQLKASGLSFYQGIWLGATELQKQGIYAWNSTGLPVGYTNWYTGQPDRNGGSEHCMTMISGDFGKWNDVDCNSTSHMTMCEKIIL